MWHGSATLAMQICTMLAAVGFEMIVEFIAAVALTRALWGVDMQLAGPQQSGINVVQKATQAVNTGKVLLALNSISGILKVKAPLPPLSYVAKAPVD